MLNRHVLSLAVACLQVFVQCGKNLKQQSTYELRIMNEEELKN